MCNPARCRANGQLGFAGGADRLGERATGMETAPRRRIDRVRWIAGKGGGLDTPVGVHRRHRRQQRLGIGMEGPLVDVVDGADLDNLSEIHDQHAVADILHHIQIMGDEEGSGISISSRAEELGDNQGEIDGEVEGEVDDQSRIAFNNKYLSEVLDVLGDGEIAFEITSASSPGVVRSVSKEGYTHVVMPMFVQW